MHKLKGCRSKADPQRTEKGETTTLQFKITSTFSHFTFLTSMFLQPKYKDDEVDKFS